MILLTQKLYTHIQKYPSRINCEEKYISKSQQYLSVNEELQITFFSFVFHVSTIDVHYWFNFKIIWQYDGFLSELQLLFKPPSPFTWHLYLYCRDNASLLVMQRQELESKWLGMGGDPGKQRPAGRKPNKPCVMKLTNAVCKGAQSLCGLHERATELTHWVAGKRRRFPSSCISPW